jgi:hypothetical protein
MPAFVFATRAMHAAALPLLDSLGEPVTMMRNPDSSDPRPVHMVTNDQLARLRPLFERAGIQIEMLHPVASNAPADVAHTRAAS